jgi:ABC-type polar amino acid transport system ATPase subunit
LIKVHELAKRYGAQEVLRGVTLEVERGEVVAIIGASGSGKSTFLRCLNGLERLDSGTIEIAGTTLHAGAEPALEQRLHAAIRARVGMVFQQFHLFPHLSVIENLVEAPIHVAGRPLDEARARAMALLERVGLAAKAHARPSTLSGGEQQRVAIARALAMEPEAILFDEPTSALDPRMAGEVLGVLSDLARDGLTMVVVTHAMGFARRAARRVHVFHAGRVIESGPPEQVLDHPREPATRALLEIVKN